MSKLAIKHEGPVSEAELPARARMVLLLSVGITFLLYMVPHGEKIAYPLLLISTLAHELGHGIAAMLAGGHFDRFVMNWDGSGMASWSSSGMGGLGRAFVAAGGLVGPAVVAAIGFALARKPRRARIALGLGGVALVLAEVLVVRNGFGLVFVAVFAAICLALAAWANETVAQASLVFLCVQLALSVYSRGDYLFVKSAGFSANGKELASDVEHMSQALGLPYWFWGGLCAAFSLAVLVIGGWVFLRPARKSATTSLRPGAHSKLP